MDAILHARPRSTAFECGVDSAMISASDDENGAPAASEVELDSQSNSREDDLPSPDPEEHEQMHHQRKRKRRDARLEDLEKLLQQSAERGEKAAAQRAEMAHERQVVLLQEERDHFRQVMADLNGEFIQNCQQMITAFHHQQLSLLQMYMNSTQDTQKVQVLLQHYHDHLYSHCSHQMHSLHHHHHMLHKQSSSQEDSHDWASGFRIALLK
ncbi:protein disconnected-like [Ornithodoros turicata]|uniref:protein disconnected-like n=1 Tax=Ornithodoros turicata TaxID=34597 RepID=UPI00313A0C73